MLGAGYLFEAIFEASGFGEVDLVVAVIRSTAGVETVAGLHRHRRPRRAESFEPRSFTGASSQDVLRTRSGADDVDGGLAAEARLAIVGLDLRLAGKMLATFVIVSMPSFADSGSRQAIDEQSFSVADVSGL